MNGNIRQAVQAVPFTNPSSAESIGRQNWDLSLRVTVTRILNFDIANVLLVLITVFVVIGALLDCPGPSGVI